MSISRTTRKQQHRRYSKEVVAKSMFDNSPTLVINRYRAPNTYREAVSNVISAFKDGTPFNRAVDQASAVDPRHLNRNKLAEHTLKYIANDY